MEPRILRVNADYLEELERLAGELADYYTLDQIDIRKKHNKKISPINNARQIRGLMEFYGRLKSETNSGAGNSATQPGAAASSTQSRTH